MFIEEAHINKGERQCNYAITSLMINAGHQWPGQGKKAHDWPRWQPGVELRFWPRQG